MPVGVLQDDPGLAQLHHEGALAVEDVVSSADPREVGLAG